MFLTRLFLVEFHADISVFSKSRKFSVKFHDNIHVSGVATGVSGGGHAQGRFSIRTYAMTKIRHKDALEKER